ncbi:acyl-CoA dehydrogenase family protein [Streptomyces sp. DSM 44915]|uniref:Acyl-CoA dehydrogenase family protein n=1 Tax=Streptomyces chisholmiae TaxID=3075540 RepID=A0ABU2JN09_9ACTN|nr:acyl-CoA dehydrogenase family protein [Streptomyces sp. DSM 44915]MDT0266098.1 acyl-CoA dehydrogenase family protein [Streptomyces sp. DSM 44915]
MPLDDAATLVDGMLPTLRDRAAEVDRAAAFPEDNLNLLRENGLLGLLVPADYGGLGGGLADLTDLAQRLAGACLSTGMIWAMHCQQVDSLVRHAAPELKDHVLPRVARGELYLASVTTEPGKGGHLLTGGAPLRAAEGSLLLDRDAPIVTGGAQADGFLITMRSAEEAADREVSLVYADRDQLDIVPQEGWHTLGMRGTSSGGLKLSGRVPPGNVVGEPGNFRHVAMESMAPVGHLAWAACWLGTAHSALRGVLDLIRSRNRPRGLDPSSDLVRERLARVRMDLELVSAYLHRVRQEVDDHRAAGTSVGGPSTQVHLNTLKVAAAEHTFAAVHKLVQLCGLFSAYRTDAAIPLERHFRDLRSASLNYADDRLLTANGALSLLDRTARLA